MCLYLCLCGLRVLCDLRGLHGSWLHKVEIDRTLLGSKALQKMKVKAVLIESASETTNVGESWHDRVTAAILDNIHTYVSVYIYIY